MLTEEKDLDRSLAFLFRRPLTIELSVNEIGYSLGLQGGRNAFCTLLRGLVGRRCHGTGEGVVRVEHLGAFALVVVDDVRGWLLGCAPLA